MSNSNDSEQIMLYLEGQDIEDNNTKAEEFGDDFWNSDSPDMSFDDSGFSAENADENKNENSAAEDDKENFAQDEASAERKPLKNISVKSEIAGKQITLQGYDADENTFIITHTSIKRAMLRLMGQSLSKKDITPIRYHYETVSSNMDHCIVNCTFSIGNYEVTETGESIPASLSSAVSKMYPYLEAQRRAFDRAVISFLQLDLDGRMIYSDSELPEQ